MAYCPPDSVIARGPIGLCDDPPGDHAGQLRVVGPHLVRGGPGGLDILAADLGGALPLLARPADRDGVADRRAVTDHQIEPPLGGLDYDGAGPDATLLGNDLA